VSDESGPTDDKKGRPTPSRREAEAARKAEMKRTLTRKEQSERQRQARAEIRRKQQESLRSGEGKYLPARDQGPVKRFVRDYIDSRWNFGEFLLPLLVIILVFSIYASSTQETWAARTSNALSVATILVVIVDSWRVTRAVKRQVAQRFGADQTRGVRFYALMRSTQLRRLRMPKPAVRRGGTPRP